MKSYTFWHTTNKYNKQIRPVKRYVLVFNTFTNNDRLSRSQSEYDDINDCLDEAKELDVLYKMHKLPLKKKVIKKYKNSWNEISERVETCYDFSDRRSWWGYLILDMKDCKCIKVGGYGYRLSVSVKYNGKILLQVIERANQINGSLHLLDYFFRDITVCPEDYEFDGNEEYNGWLQFRWGDGKNAINYVKPKKNKNKEIGFDIETNGLSNFPKEDDEIKSLKEYFDDTYVEEDIIESKFSDIIDKETQKRLMDRYGW